MSSKFLMIIGALFTALTLMSETDRRQSDREWRVYSGDLAGTKYSALDQINRSNVTQLEPAWIFRTGDMRQQPRSTIECNPIILDRVMYITSPALKVMALHAATGEKRWTFDPFDGRGGRGVNRGLASWTGEDGTRIFFVAGLFLYALDAATGELVKGFGTEGRVDLRQGLDRDVFFLSVTATTPGIVYKDLYILGSVVGEGPNASAPGHIRAFDVRTGERRWIFHTIPYPGEPGYETWSPDSWKTVGGANSWGGFTLDSQRGYVYCGTGSPAYDHYGGNRVGQNLFGNCVLALAAETGELKWFFQAVHHDLWDYDIPCPPNLVTVHHDGREIDALAQVTKMGHMFLLNRHTGHPLFPVEERPVPQSEIPGEASWPTQPFPVKPPAYAQQRLTEAEATDWSPASGADARRRLREMRTGEIFIPPGFEPSVTLPQFNGGTDWGGAAVDPERQVLYVNASNEAEWISMVESKLEEEMTMAQLGQRLYAVICSNCHGYEKPPNPASPSFASLKTVKERLTYEEVLQLLETGRNQMPSFEVFSDTEKHAVASFLFGQGTDEIISTEDLNLSWAEEIPYVATGHREFRGPEGYPVNRRPWGTLTAIDLNRGEILWQSPLGTYPALEEKGLPPTGTFNMGGPVVTAGGVVFIGGAMDERFHAYDKFTGELLWEYQMEAGGYATPATYEIDGKQFVVIAAGGGGKPGTKPGDAFYCFSLPD